MEISAFTDFLCGAGKRRMQQETVKVRASLLQRYAKEDKDQRLAHQRRYEQYRTRNTGAAAKTLCYLFWGHRFEGAGAALIFALAQQYHTDNIADLEYKTMLQQALDHHLLCNPAELAAFVDAYAYNISSDEPLLCSLQSVVECASVLLGGPDPVADGLHLELWLVGMFQLSHPSLVIRHLAVKLCLLLLSQADSDTRTGILVCDNSVRPIMCTADLAEIYEDQSMQFSLDLARCNSQQTTAQLLIQITGKLGALDFAGQSRMISILVPWCPNLRLGDYRRLTPPDGAADAGTSQVLDCLFKITQSYGQKHDAMVKRVWFGVSTVPENIASTIGFLLDTVCETQDNDPGGEIFGLCSKKITLYLAKRRPEDAIEKLVREMTEARLSGTTHGEVRSKVATMLVAEAVCCCQIHQIRSHIPLLVHVSLLSLEDLRGSLILNLVQSVVAKNLPKWNPTSRAECQRSVQLLVRYFATIDIAKVWQDDNDQELLWVVPTVCHICENFGEVADLRMRWSRLACQYALLDQREIPVRRSHQVRATQTNAAKCIIRVLATDAMFMYVVW